MRCIEIQITWSRLAEIAAAFLLVIALGSLPSPTRADIPVDWNAPWPARTSPGVPEARLNYQPGLAPRLWSLATAETLMARYPDYRSAYWKPWTYVQGYAFRAFELLYDATKDPRYLSYIRLYIDNFVDTEGNFHSDGEQLNNLDNLMTGSAIVALYERSGEERYKKAAAQFRRAFDSYPRNSDGGFWHGHKATGQMWVDGVFMGQMFLLRYGRVIGDTAYCYDEAARQITVFAQRAHKGGTGLYFHAFTERPDLKNWADPATGLSPEVWSEGLGWYALVLSEALATLPAEHGKRKDILKIYLGLAAALKRMQDKRSGAWYMIVDKPEGAGNWTDPSGTGMFVYALQRGIDLGLIDTREYGSVVANGYYALRKFARVNGHGLTDVYGGGDGISVKPSYDAYVTVSRTKNAKEAVIGFLWGTAIVEQAEIVHRLKNTASAVDVVRQAESASGPELAWTKKQLFIGPHENAAVADFNRDGHIDIVSGSNIFVGPDFVVRPYRANHLAKEYVRENSVHPYDVDGDGWIDVIVGTWMEDGIFWYRNPGTRAADQKKPWEMNLPWEAHLLTTTRGTMEMFAFHDYDGDGVPEMHSANYRREHPLEVFRFSKDEAGNTNMKAFVLGPHGGGHGIAFGDVNGDGREDVLCETGWYERPAGDIWAGPWKFHTETNLNAMHPSCPFAVKDLNEDGRLDLVFGRGHNVGLFWWEQLAPKADGTTQWKQHLIDATWSQAHCLAWADLDGDKQDELIAGKCLWAHDGGDLGAADPLVVYYYSWDRAAQRFMRHTICGPEDDIALNRQFAVADLNKDGRPDLVAPSKKGLWILYNEGLK
jgi:unsaturated rhamnogalacturonyl hydrolase